MRSLFRSEGNEGSAGSAPALPPAMTPHELALVEAYFNRKGVVALLRALFGAVREAPPRHRRSA